MTETELSKELGLTKAAVGYHLRPLKDAELIKIDRYETEEHGISKYYSAAAALFIVDPDQIPEDVRRRFLETQINHAEGMLSVFKLYNNRSIRDLIGRSGRIGKGDVGATQGCWTKIR